jgi:predicted dehydrogenase/threonine dehydrogenase-like Zn-dependent dehydrogenase
MKQVLQSYRTGELKVADVPAPGVEPGSILVRTTASLVSVGTERMGLKLARKSLLGKARERPDLVKKVIERVARDGVVATGRAVFNRLDQAIPLGYSCVGRVVAVGEGVFSFAVGDRVACAGAKIANHAEVNLVPQNLAVSVPDAVDDEAAAFVTVGAVALQGLRVAQPTLGETFAVIGLGLIGQITCQLLAASGCRVLGIDLDEGKVELARRLGCNGAVARASDVVHAAEAMTAGRGVDGVLITAATSSNDPVELAGNLCRDRARVIVVGTVSMQVPRRPYYDKELSFWQSRSYGPGRYDPLYEEMGIDYPLGYVRWTEQRNMQAFLEQCAGKRVGVKELITQRFGIDRAEDAYKQIAADSTALGVILTYPTDATLARTVDLQSSPRRPADYDVRISVLGAGAFALSTLIPAVCSVDDVRLVCVASSHGVSAQHAAKKYGFDRCSSDDLATIADPDSNVVFISTRHDLHATEAVASLLAGKHVFVEKPLALDSASLDEIMVVAGGSDRILMVGFNRRFAPLATELRTFFAERRQPLVASYRINAGPVPASSWMHDPAVGGGRLLGEGCHFIDFLSFLIGAAPTSVLTRGTRSSGGVRSDDNFVITLSFADGSVGTVTYVASADPTAGKERLEVLGDGAWAQLDDFRELRLRRGGKERVVRKLAQDKGHRREVKAFIDAIRTGGPSPISLSAIGTSMRATFAALESLGAGRPIEVSE